MSLICHASMTDSVYRSIHGYNVQQLLLPKTRYNKLHTSEHTGYNDQQLLLAITQYNKLHTTEPACTSTMEYLHTVKLY